MRILILLLASLTFAMAASAADPVAKEDAIFVAAEKGDLAAIKKFVGSGGKPDAADKEKLTLMNWAAYGGGLEVVKFLIANHADVNSNANPKGWTPLMNASAQGHTAIVTYLLDHGATMGTLNTEGYSALSFAAAKQRADVVKVLLAKGADRGNGLVGMARKGDTAGIRLLLDNGVDVNATPQTKESFYVPGETALYAAAEANNAEIVALLLDRGAGPNVMTPEGGNMPTPLTFAAYFCNGAMIDTLLQHGASRRLANASGSTALDLATSGWTDDMKPCPPDIIAKLSGG